MQSQDSFGGRPPTRILVLQLRAVGLQLFHNPVSLQFVRPSGMIPTVSEMARNLWLCSFWELARGENTATKV